MTPPVERRDRILVASTAVIAVLLVGNALRATHTVSTPFVFSFFITLLVYPLQRWLQQRLPKHLKWLGLVAAFATVLVCLAGVAGSIVFAISTVMTEFPKHATELRAEADRVMHWAQSQGLSKSDTPEALASLKQHAAQLGTQGLAGVWAVGVFLVLVVFFVLLMMMEAPVWRGKVEKIFSGRDGGRLLEACTASGIATRRYLLDVATLGLITSVLEFFCFTLYGVDLAFVWALLFFLLNFIPFVGSVIAAVPPIFFAIATQGVARGLLVGLTILVIEQVMGNLVAPLFQGKRMRLSAVVVLGSVTFWGWVWGAVGALLAVPITVTLLMVCARLPSTEWVAVLLGEEGKPGKEAVP